ncbi:Regulatory protein Spx [Sporotomaculum syntrophicum]|uniref:Regulatory protein Spx n=1 Tax=Sporotomaculum syntrophicum TaxID=182264 RepID=A0A9D2WSJ7_9FIRM|nr:Regulatory protein Spx [Sporotomaculum syntrophicum]
MKKAKNWLAQNEIAYQTRHIVDEHPTREEIIDLHKKSGLELKKLFNTSGAKYKELGLKNIIKTASADELYDILASDGLLVKRPIITDGEKVLFGFNEKDWERVFAKSGQ